MVSLSLCSNLDDIWSSRPAKAFHQLIRDCCTKSYIQFGELLINFDIDFFMWRYCDVKTIYVEPGKSKRSLLSNAFIFGYLFEVDSLK